MEHEFTIVLYSAYDVESLMRK